MWENATIWWWGGCKCGSFQKVVGVLCSGFGSKGFGRFPAIFGKTSWGMTSESFGDMLKARYRVSTC